MICSRSWRELVAKPGLGIQSFLTFVLLSACDSLAAVWARGWALPIRGRGLSVWVSWDASCSSALAGLSCKVGIEVPGLEFKCHFWLFSFICHCHQFTFPSDCFSHHTASQFIPSQLQSLDTSIHRLKDVVKQRTTALGPSDRSRLMHVTSAKPMTLNPGI